MKRETKLYLILKFVGLWLLLIILTTFVGCASRFSIAYKLDPASPSGVTTHPVTIAIAPFLDERPHGERTTPQNVVITQVSLEIAAAIARHFEHDKLFLRQEMVADSFARPTRDQLTLLKSMGYDTILIGSISHFFGLLADMKNQRLIVGLSALFPVLLIPGVALKKPYVGYTELTNLQVLDTGSGRVVWEGRVERKEIKDIGGFETLSKIYSVAIESLKNSVTDLSEEIRKASF